MHNYLGCNLKEYLDDIAAELFGHDLGQILVRMGLELFEEDTIGGDFAQYVAVGRARHAQTNRTTRTVPRHANNSHLNKKKIIFLPPPL